MITPNQIKEKILSTSSHGYDIDETNAFIDEIAASYEAVYEENKELYRKMEILASKIEEYRAEEDSIKDTLLTAQKAAKSVQSEAKQKAETLLAESAQTVQRTVLEAKEKAEQIVSEARNFASDITKEKTEEADAIVKNAEAQADETLNTAKSSAAALLQEVKTKALELIEKSNKEKEYNENLVSKLKEESSVFKANLVALYNAQLEKLQQMMDNSEDASIAETAQSLDDAKAQFEELLVGFEEPVEEEAVPAAALDFEPIDDPEEAVDEAYEPEEDITIAGEADFELTEEELENGNFEIEGADEPEEEEPPKEQIRFDEDVVLDGNGMIKPASAEEQKPVPPAEQYHFTKADVDSALDAFSQETLTPIEEEAAVSEIEEEAELEEPEEEKLPFENFFNVKGEAQRTDEVISLLPPEDDEDEDDDDDLKFRGFFKKKKK